MRNALCRGLVEIASQPDFVFLTGDLGYKALEPLRDAIGSRFINAGVAEQNMISVAAGLARTGLKPWVYSIAPFAYARPFEQIRNDICLHDLPVTIVGNGGGYGYGVMGATHHALEDYGVLLTLQNMHVFVPAFASDLATLVPRLQTFAQPAYLRLGSDEAPADCAVPPYSAWRHVLPGDGPTLVVVGPLAGSILTATRDMESARRPSIWVLSELPIRETPAAFLTDLDRSGHLFVTEEHVAVGSAGQALVSKLVGQGIPLRRFTHRVARGYVSGRYGSQKFHRQECGLDAASIVADLMEAQPC